MKFHEAVPTPDPSEPVTLTMTRGEAAEMALLVRMSIRHPRRPPASLMALIEANRALCDSEDESVFVERTVKVFETAALLGAKGE